MNRRQFMNKGAALLAMGSIVGQNVVAQKPNKGRIGLQLWCLKAELPIDFEGTLKKVSDIGYSAVELWNLKDGKFYNRPLEEVNRLLKEMGMSISGTHTIGTEILSENVNDKEWDFWKKSAASLKSVGGKWMIQAGYLKAKTVADLKRIAAHYNRVAEVCKTEGVKFGYHNREYEFDKIEGTVFLDFLIRNTDPKLVYFEMDWGHAVRGGGDCVRYMRDFKKRIPIWLASDFDVASGKYVEVGKGSVPYPALFDLVKSSGLEQLTVEQEDTEGDVFAKCKNNFDYMKRFKWTKA